MAAVEDGSQLGHLLQAGVAADTVVAGDDPAVVEDRSDLLEQAPVLGALRGQLMAAQGELVLRVAGNAVLLRHLLGGLPHGLPR